jgi:hypothetical protein
LQTPLPDGRFESSGELVTVTASASLSQDVRRFLGDYIRCSEDLDVLMLVRSDPKREWSAFEVSDRLRLEPFAASNRLVSLHLAGLLAQRPGTGRMYNFRYHAPRHLDRLAEELALIYSRYRAEICEYIDHHQRGQMEALASAFILKRDI